MAGVPPAPPRLTGDAKQDIIAIAQWANDFYKAIVLEAGGLIIEIGTLTVNDPDTTAIFTLAAEELKTDYIVLLTPSGETGTPAAGARDVKAIAKTTKAFTITVVAAPGAGASVTFDCLVLRRIGEA